MLAYIIIGAASFLASGILFRHKTILTFVAAGGIFFEAQVLVSTLAARGLEEFMDKTVVYLVGSFVMLGLWLAGIKNFRWIKFEKNWWFKEASLLMGIAIVAIAAAVILAVNGWHGGNWIMSGFYNGDTTTFLSLFNRSREVDGLVVGNPFNGGGELEYPVLLHAAYADALGAWGGEYFMFYLLPVLVFVQVVIAVPVFYLWCRVYLSELRKGNCNLLGVGSEKALVLGQMFLILYVLALSWDGYVYAQSHFFLTGMFILLVALLYSLEKDKIKNKLLGVLAVSFLGIALILSNAVLGAVAAAIIVLFFGFTFLSDERAGAVKKIIFSVLAAVWLIFYLVMSSGEAAWGRLGFSYSAAFESMRLAPATIAVLVSLLILNKRKSLIGLYVVAVIGMAVMTHLFSGRDIIVENSSRFIYHGVLVGYVLVLEPGVRFFYWLKKELVHSRLGLFQKVVGWSALAGVFLIVLWPALASVLVTHDSLMRKDRHVVSAQEIEAMRWIKENTRINDVFIARVESPWVIPLFTGRAILRSDYWLSEKDDVFKRIEMAFEGDKYAQKEVLAKGNYLALMKNIDSEWDLAEMKPVYENQAYEIFKIN